MREHRQKAIATLVLFALGISALGFFFAGSSVASGKGLGSDAKPMVIESRPDKDVRVNSGWKLFLVGTNEYDNLDKKYDLHYAVKDVQSLKSQFMALGVPEENIVILTSERGRFRSNQKNILRSFDNFVSGLTRNDSAFVYLSGHGFQFEGDERAYYAPADIDPEEIRDTGVSIDDMQKQLAQSDAKLKWMTVDACRNDPVKDSKTTSRDFPSGVTSACIVNPSDLPDAFVFMQGCGKGQCSHESNDLEQGLLTYSLLEALRCDDNPAERNESGELEFVELINYVQKRTQELARRCRDDSNTPLEQKPRITCAQLPSFTLLTNLRRDGLTPTQWQEVADFENYIANNDIARAEEALVNIVGFFCDGENAQKYKELYERLQAAKRRIELNNELVKKRKDDEKCYKSAQDALNAKEYASALTYIDDAIELDNSSEYQDFHSGDLARAVKAAVNQAIIDGNLAKAKSLNGLLAELDENVARKNDRRIAALESTPPSPDTEHEAGELKTLTIAGVKVNFHWAPAGTFQMGSPSSESGRDDDETQHKVELTKGFWIAETETTQELWKAVMGNNPSYFKGDQLPVEQVSWNDCRDFVAKLNSSYSSALPSGYKYAMPTEAQWEYACRAGTTTPFGFGSTLNGDKANCNGNYPYGTDTQGTYKGETTKVGSYAPNAWGLYDMHGNVWEWCADWFGRDYYASSSATKDPTGPSSGSNRVLRGGSWDLYAGSCRSANRHNYGPDYRFNFYGFRLVLVR